MKFIALFEELSMNDLSRVGGKNASLGEMIQYLSPQGVPIPQGFVLTAEAYRLHLHQNNLTTSIAAALALINRNDISSIQAAGKKIRQLIAQAPLHQELIEEVRTAYSRLEQDFGPSCAVALRSSATAEDLPSASFAGQQETFLNIRGIDQLFDHIPLTFASLFTDRAIAYRIDHGFDHLDIALSIGVQCMIDASDGASGVIFTLDTESGFPDALLITSSYGLGEPIVQGTITPDEMYVHKPTLRQGYSPIIKKSCGLKESRMIYSTPSSTSPTTTIPVEKQLQTKYSISDDEVLQLARFGLIIEDYYSKKNGSWTPMDIEWAKDGVTNKLFIVQARPETIHSQARDATITLKKIDATSLPNKKILCQGQSVGSGAAGGVARIISDSRAIQDIRAGDILVTEMTNPDWEPIMKKAAGIITNRGGRTCHAAIVSRELGIPAIVGTSDATSKITDGTAITIDCSNGSEGLVYEGILKITDQVVQINKKPDRPYRTMITIGHPHEAFKLARFAHEGVGLARLEFIINSAIKIHPMALIHPEKTDPTTQTIIREITEHYPSPSDYFTQKLAEQAGTIAAAFYPQPVIIRLSDFKTNEYRRLIGGAFFEPEEENPMLGFRGAARYHHELYREAFKLECDALNIMRNKMGFKNIIVMIPFVRTPAEARAVIATMAHNGLRQGDDDFKIYMMCELPSNVILMHEFCTIFDGFSIGSNDLTQTILGIDRDSTLVAHLFNELDPAVLTMIKEAIVTARHHGKEIGICGQAPSDYPHIQQHLADWGISSISLTPDAFIASCAQP